MMSVIRSFKPNWLAVGLGLLYLITFIVYFAGFTAFNKTYMPLFYSGEKDPLTSIKWFLVSWPIAGFLISVALIAVAPFEWRQVLFAFCALLSLEFVGFALISVFLAANIARFRSEGGWELCQKDPRCSTLKHGSNGLLAGALLSTLVVILQLIFSFMRVQKIGKSGESYGELKVMDDHDAINGADEDEAYFSNQTLDDDGEELMDQPV